MAVSHVFSACQRVFGCVGSRHELSRFSWVLVTPNPFAFISLYSDKKWYFPGCSSTKWIYMTESWPVHCGQKRINSTFSPGARQSSAGSSIFSTLHCQVSATRAAIWWTWLKQPESLFGESHWHSYWTWCRSEINFYFIKPLRFCFWLCSGSSC